MDQIWLASPSPALRLWPGSRGPTWRLNPAAVAWARGRQLNESSWRDIATAISSVHESSPEREGLIVDPPLRWRSLPMSTGWLIWLLPEPVRPAAGDSALHDDGSERASTARSEFLARMSHELRTPLNAVLGFAQLIEHDGASAPAHVQLDRVALIREAGQQLLRPIGEVLEHLKRDATVDARDSVTALPDDNAIAGAAAPSRPLSVVYIEDNPVNVLLVEELVAMRPQTRLRCAVTGLAGVALAAAGAPDVVLVDMQLPDIDGFEVLRRLRANRALDRSAVIALSANGIGDDIALALAAGFDDYWTKPIDFRHFLIGLDTLAQAR